MTCCPKLYVLIHYYFTTFVKVVKSERSWPFNCLVFADFLIVTTFIMQLVNLFYRFLKTFLGFIIQFISNIQILKSLNLILFALVVHFPAVVLLLMLIIL